MVFNVKKYIRKLPNENLRRMAWGRAFSSMTQTEVIPENTDKFNYIKIF